MEACKLARAVVLGLLYLTLSSASVFAQVDFPIGYSSLGGTYAFLALMEEQKLLEKDGIRPTFVYIGGPQISQALIAGDIRMAVLGAASPVRAAAHGAEARFIGGITDKENITVVSDPKITKPADLKGTRMAGRMGNERVTIKKLQVIQADPERNLLVVKGSVPGATGGLLMIKKHVMR